ncbi:MAG: hypothetical protein HYY09_05395 [Firmicutes bacterium]|nr:hypothetical protein [Bacillota bacterium]
MSAASGINQPAGLGAGQMDLGRMAVGKTVSGGIEAITAAAGQAPARRTGPGTFADALSAAAEKGVVFSAHARKRLEQGQVRLEAEAGDRLARAVSKAAERGSRESLILLEDLALVVSVQNRTVITAVPQPRSRSGVFSNIDSTVIA